MPLDVDKLLKAADNEANKSILKHNKQEIKQTKNDVLQRLGLHGKQLAEIHKKLRDYRFIEDLDSLNYGSFVRWIDLRDPEDVYMTNGGIVCDMCPTEDDIIVKCKNPYNRFFQFYFNKCLVFQKLTQQESVLLSAMEYLNK